MMNRILKIAFSILILLAFPDVYAQQSHVPAPKAKRAFENGLRYYHDRDPARADKELLKAISIDSLYVDPLILLGDISYDKGRPDEALAYYEKALSIDPAFSAAIYFLAGKASLEINDFDGAVSHLKNFLAADRIDRQQAGMASEMLKQASFRRHALANPVDFQPVNLGPGVNSVHHEYVNSITLDESQMTYTLTQPDTTTTRGRLREGIMMAERKDSVWMRKGKTLPDLHELGNIGAMSLTPDGRFLFFTSCGSSMGYGSCDLFVCGREGDEWSRPQNLGSVVNTANWDSQPCFSADGQTLYFSSSRKGGQGGSDIWLSTFRQGVGWSKPRNAGPAINTREEEMAPFIHADGQTLYFSSKGHVGMGGFDLFVSRKDSTGSWTRAQNLGYPINTADDEINILISTNGRMAYISSDMEGGIGGYDIYSFDLPPAFAPDSVAYLTGRVFDAETKESLSAELQLIDLISGELSVRCGSDPASGKYMAALPGGKNYALNVSKQGYIFYSENVDLTAGQMDAGAVKKDIYLNPIKKGQSFVMNNVFFETDEYSLSKLSRTELDKLYSMLVLNPDVNIMICGHTDDVGSAEYNQQLSEKRAKAVYSYLIEDGIPPSRLQYKGFGKSQPVSENDTEEGRALNRRTEIIIL